MSVATVTTRALHEAPGLELTGVVEAVGGGFGDGGVHRALARAHGRLADARLRIVPCQARGLRLPIVAECATTGQPARASDHEAPGLAPDAPTVGLDPGETVATPPARSAEAASKRAAAKAGIERVERLIADHDAAVHEGRLRFDRKLVMSDEAAPIGDWAAVIHADGNGLGEIFLGFGRVYAEHRTDPPDDRRYVDALRDFSEALDGITAGALARALRAMRFEDTASLPVAPLVLGGDDLTLYCTGSCAVDLTVAFLREFVRGSSAEPVGPIVARRFGAGKLGACAGVAIGKPHHPFHAMYELSEELMKSAKTVKRQLQVTNAAKETVPAPSAALDFHVLADGALTALDHARKRGTGPDGLRLFGGPYVVEGVARQDCEWLRTHRWERLDETAQRARETALPASKLHRLRGALARGAQPAERCANLLRGRDREALMALLGGEGLVTTPVAARPEGDVAAPEDVTPFTVLPDAIELADLRGLAR